MWYSLYLIYKSRAETKMLQIFFEGLICAAGLQADVAAGHVQHGGDLLVAVSLPEVPDEDLLGDGIEVLEGELDCNVLGGDLKDGRGLHIVGEGDFFVPPSQKVNGLIIRHGKDPFLRRLDIFCMLHVQDRNKNLLRDIFGTNTFSETNTEVQDDLCIVLLIYRNERPLIGFDFKEQIVKLLWFHCSFEGILLLRKFVFAISSRATPAGIFPLTHKQNREVIIS